MRRLLSSALAGVCALTAAPPAFAQLALNATLQSDYRYRGRSLSDQQPTLSLGVSYDHPSGFYAGASAIAERTDNHGVEKLGDIEYAGYAVRLDRGPALDVGLVRTAVSSYEPVPRKAAFTEAYAGLLTDHLSFRTYYADDYYQLGFHTLYADLGAAIRPARNLRLVAHVGALAPVGSAARGRPNRYDYSVGAVATAGANEVSVSWTGASPVVIYPDGDRERGAVVVALKHFF